jgi:2-amino-4-hydroxy-6-hydroxymethyldihydropteridine diphosphokinase
MMASTVFRPNGWTFLGLGSNLGDRYAALCHAIQACDEIPNADVIGWSHCYETQPWGPLAAQQTQYLNMVLVLQETLAPQALLAALQGIEAAMGRYHGTVRPRWSARIIDVDVLWQRGEPYYDSSLVMPHPRFHQRRFVLQPLADLVPGMRPPGMSHSVTQMLHALRTPKQEVRLYCRASDMAHHLEKARAFWPA